MTRREARASLARGGAEASASLPKAESPRLLRRQWRAQHVSPAQAEASTGSGSRGPGERAPRSRRSGRTPRRGPGAFAKFGLAACAILGIGAALTSAAWSDTVAFESDVQIAQFQMEYSWTNADGSWHPFVSGGQIRLDQINQWIDPSTQMTPHWIFVRNLGQSSTNIRIDVTRGGVFENRDFLRIGAGQTTPPGGGGGSVSEFDGDSVTIAVAGTQRAQIRLEIVPSALPPHNENRTGDLTINVTGTVGPPGTLQGPSSALADRDGQSAVAAVRREIDA